MPFSTSILGWAPWGSAPTFAGHEGLQELCQRARVRVHLRHLVEVVVGDDNILGVAGHVDDLGTDKDVVGGCRVAPPPCHLDRERGGGHPWRYLAVLVLEGGREEVDWEMGLHQPWGWGFLQLLDACGTGGLAVQAPAPSPPPGLSTPPPPVQGAAGPGGSPLGSSGAFISRKGTRLKMASRRHFSASPS